MTGQRIALKIGFCLTAFVWAFASIEKDWGAFYTFVFCIIALAFGASVALEMGRLGAQEWEDE